MPRHAPVSPSRTQLRAKQGVGRPKSPRAAPPARRKLSRKDVIVALAHFGFCSTGVISAVLIDWGELHGMSRTETLIQIFPSFVGPSFCCLYLFNQTNQRRYDWKFLVITFCDLLGMVLLVTSINLAGSAIFFVTFSWITVFAAIWKKIFLGKDQTCYQWISLVVLTGGLCVSAVGAKMDYGEKVLLGVLCGIGSSLVYSVYYIFCDVLGHQEDAPSPEALAAFDGLTGTWILGLYILVFDGPRWEEVVLKPMEEEDGHYVSLTISFCCLAISYLVHQLGFFYIAKHSGCVLAGINKSIQTVSVFVVSTVFCKVQPSQCFSSAKLASVIIVVIGVLMYAHATSFVEEEKAPAMPSNRKLAHRASKISLLNSTPGKRRNRSVEMTPQGRPDLSIDIDEEDMLIARTREHITAVSPANRELQL